MKLQSPVSEEHQTYKYEFCYFVYLDTFLNAMKEVCLDLFLMTFFRRWARSTLVLVPLFGVHYTVFLGMSYSIGVNETVEIVWLFCDQLFASFQVGINE